MESAYGKQGMCSLWVCVLICQVTVSEAAILRDFFQATEPRPGCCHAVAPISLLRCACFRTPDTVARHGRPQINLCYAVSTGLPLTRPPEEPSFGSRTLLTKEPTAHSTATVLPMNTAPGWGESGKHHHHTCKWAHGEGLIDIYWMDGGVDGAQFQILQGDKKN